MRTIPTLALAVALAIAQTGPARAGDTEVRLDQVGAWQVGAGPAGNQAIVEQYGSASRASIIQRGQGNSAVIRQQGEDNLAASLQLGNGDRASVTQSGDDNSVVHEQLGDGLSLTITQQGSSHVTITQQR